MRDLVTRWGSMACSERLNLAKNIMQIGVGESYVSKLVIMSISRLHLSKAPNGSKRKASLLLAMLVHSGFWQNVGLSPTDWNCHNLYQPFMMCSMSPN